VPINVIKTRNQKLIARDRNAGNVGKHEGRNGGFSNEASKHVDASKATRMGYD